MAAVPARPLVVSRNLRCSRRRCSPCLPLLLPCFAHCFFLSSASAAAAAVSTATPHGSADSSSFHSISGIRQLQSLSAGEGFFQPGGFGGLPTLPPQTTTTTTIPQFFFKAPVVLKSPDTTSTTSMSASTITTTSTVPSPTFIFKRPDTITFSSSTRSMTTASFTYSSSSTGSVTESTSTTTTITATATWTSTETSSQISSTGTTTQVTTTNSLTTTSSESSTTASTSITLTATSSSTTLPTLTSTTTLTTSSKTSTTSVTGTATTVSSKVRTITSTPTSTSDTKSATLSSLSHTASSTLSTFTATFSSSSVTSSSTLSSTELTNTMTSVTKGTSTTLASSRGMLSSTLSTKALTSITTRTASSITTTSVSTRTQTTGSHTSSSTFSVFTTTSTSSSGTFSSTVSSTKVTHTTTATSTVTSSKSVSGRTKSSTVSKLTTSVSSISKTSSGTIRSTEVTETVSLTSTSTNTLTNSAASLTATRTATTSYAVSSVSSTVTHPLTSSTATVTSTSASTSATFPFTTAGRDILKQESAAAALTLLNDERSMAARIIAEAKVKPSGKSLRVSTLTTSDGSELTVALLTAEDGLDSFEITVGDASGSVKIPKVVLEQLGGGIAAMTAGPLSQSTAQLLAETASMPTMAAAPMSVSLFDANGTALSTDLAKPIEITLQGDTNASAACVYWDRDAGLWSSRGVQRVFLPAGSSKSIVCSTSHLSIFAAVQRDAVSVVQQTFECKAESFSFSFAHLESLGSNSSWWRQVPASMLGGATLACMVAALLAVHMEFRFGKMQWVRKALSLPEDKHALTSPRLVCWPRRGMFHRGILMYCVQSQHALRAGVDVESLSLGMQICNAVTSSDASPLETPLQVAAQELAEELDLYYSASRAVCSFTRANWFMRAVLLLAALHPWNAFRKSLFTPRIAELLLAVAKLAGPLALNVFSLQAASFILAEQNWFTCWQEQAVLRPSLACAASCLLGEMAIASFRDLRHYDHASLGCDARQVRRWRLRVKLFWTLLVTYLTGSLAVMLAFLATVPKAAGLTWLYSALFNVSLQMVVWPLLVATVLASLATTSLRDRRETDARMKEGGGGPKMVASAAAVGPLDTKVLPFDMQEQQTEVTGIPVARPGSAWQAWQVPGNDRNGRFEAGCVLADYFALAHSASPPDDSRTGRLEISPMNKSSFGVSWTGVWGFGKARGSAKESSSPTSCSDVSGSSLSPSGQGVDFPGFEGMTGLPRPGTPRCMEIAMRATGLGGCQWRSDECLDDLDLPGMVYDSVQRPGTTVARPSCRSVPQRRGRGAQEKFGLGEMGHTKLDVFGSTSRSTFSSLAGPTRPPARQSPSASKGDEAMGALGFGRNIHCEMLSTTDAFGRTVTWSSRLEPTLQCITESGGEDAFPAQPFHFHGEEWDEEQFSTISFGASFGGTALPARGSFGETAFPSRERYMASEELDRSGWCWTRPAQVPDPFGASWRSSQSSLAATGAGGRASAEALMAISVTGESVHSGGFDDVESVVLDEGMKTCSGLRFGATATAWEAEQPAERPKAPWQARRPTIPWRCVEVEETEL
eukprot:TRINITY_DN1743_c0_g1_i1.p1 TRINITY_DN1743_c0_g1~~TRINITY_DN1743_c0_g1_i1.p1  ORF type:complete len:1562 (-),score=246.62 TRINITY_DN1743_c0_g1_i1:96-4781(-)